MLQQQQQQQRLKSETSKHSTHCCCHDRHHPRIPLPPTPSPKNAGRNAKGCTLSLPGYFRGATANQQRAAIYYQYLHSIAPGRCPIHCRYIERKKHGRALHRVATVVHTIRLFFYRPTRPNIPKTGGEVQHTPLFALPSLPVRRLDPTLPSSLSLSSTDCLVCLSPRDRPHRII